MVEGKRCPECQSAILKDAVVCRFCGNRIVGAKCQNCATICKPEAKICKWCGNALKKVDRLKLNKSIEIRSTIIGTFIIRRSFRAQKAVFTKDKVVISTYGFLGLSRYDEEIPWEKVAGFLHKSGIFWDTISIETRGQSAAVIWGLRNADAVRVKNMLQKIDV